MRRIICIGSRLLERDSAGPRVHAALQRLLGPQESHTPLELIDGGLAGLDLLSLVESSERVIFVDGTRGLTEPGRVAVYTAREIAEIASPHYDHAAGLPFLLLCSVTLTSPPEIHVVGLEEPSNDEAITEAADLSLRLAMLDTVRAESAAGNWGNRP